MKQTILILLLGFFVLSSFGQFYIQPSIGYTISSHPIENQSVLIINSQKTIYQTKFKYGEGMHLGINLGYCYMDNFFIELNTKQTIYSKYNISTVQPDLQSLNGINDFYLSGYFGEIDYESSVFQIVTLIGYQVKKNNFRAYFKIGPNLMKSKINHTLKYIDWELDNWEFYPLNTEKKYEYTGKFHMGLQANLGFCYSIKQNLQFVIDFVTVYNNYEITKAKIEYYEIDGVSHLDKLEDTNIEIDKEDNKLNHSHYGINVGIRYVFNRNK